MKTKKYWTSNNTLSMIKYITSTTNDEKNNIIETELYNVLYNNCEAVIRKVRNIEPTPDHIQDLLLILISKVLPAITIDKVEATQNYIWISLVNACKNDYNSESIRACNSINSTFVSTVTDFDYYQSSTSTNEFEIDINKEDIKEQIINELNNKIQSQNLLNGTNTFFLLALKDYLLANDFDASNFKSYIMKEMNINEKCFWNICSDVKIRSKELDFKLSKKYKN